MSKPNASMPLAVAAALVIGGLVVGLIGGISSGSIAGGLIAGAGLIPACYAAWVGMQQETQSSLLYAILLILASVGVGGILLLLAIFDWFV